MADKSLFNKANPHKLFAIDSLGALVTSIMLGIVLARLETTFGMPPRVLHFLSILGGIFCIYSFSCFLLKIKNWKPYLKIIAMANLLYCALSAGLVINFYEKLTMVGVTYFAVEILIVIVLAIIELKTASH